jgi:hypothetical protein
VNGGQIYVSLALPAGTVDQYSYSLGKLNNVEGAIVLSSFGNNWTRNNLNSNIILGSVALSYNGQYQTGVYNNSIYVSTDYGNIWTLTNTGYWISISISSDGQYQTAISQLNGSGNDFPIYTSNNYGVTWTKRTSSKYFFKVAVSSTGKYQTAISLNINYDGFLYTSSDYGITWTQNTNMFYGNYNSLSMSSSGQYQVMYRNVAGDYGYLYLSSNYGVTFSISNTTSGSFLSTAISGNGKYITSFTFENPSYTYYVSSNYGVSSTRYTNAPVTSITRTLISYTGQYQVTCRDAGTFGNLYGSTNYGVNWYFLNIQNNYFTSLGLSSDGVYTTIAGSWAGDTTGIKVSKATVNITSFTFNLDTGTTFYLTSFPPTANYSINFTISTLNTANTYLITVINKTSSVASFYCNAVQINGTGRTLLYTVRPTVITSSNALANAAQTNQEFIMFYNTTSAAWVVLTNIKVFKA